MQSMTVVASTSPEHSSLNARLSFRTGVKMDEEQIANISTHAEDLEIAVSLCYHATRRWFVE